MMENKKEVTKRIEYIDVLKGFLILSVVMCHVGGFCMGIQEDIPSLHFILFEFRNPPFFFVSGFFAYKVGRTWNLNYSCSVIKKKFCMIFWPTTVFLSVLLYVHPSFHGHTFLHDNISDLWFHWFTYALFLFFIFYTCIKYLSYKIKCHSTIEDCILLGCGLLCYLLFSISSVYDHLPISTEWKDLFGLQYWGFFLFFVLGALTKKHYTHFQNLLNNQVFIALCLFVFFILNIFWTPMMERHFNIFRITTYLTGIILVIYFFKYYHLPAFLNHFFLYTGRKTLDIYLIHYFFLPLALYYQTDFLRDTPLPIIEFFITLFLSVLIISMSLIISLVIRMNSLFTFFIFGEKQQKPNNSL